jgi:hypothetical protein
MKPLVWIIFLILGLAVQGWSTSAEAPAPSSAKNDKHQFSGLKLKGQLKKPDLSYIYKRKRIKAEKILNIPEDFNDEVVRGSQKL